jgi:general nucleoside transport system permease protein
MLPGNSMAVHWTQQTAMQERPMISRLKQLRPEYLMDLLPSLLAVAGALMVGAVLLMALGANPIIAYGELIKGAFGSQNALAETVVKATPLLLVGLGICIAFRGGVTNVGGEGQMVMGALFGITIALALKSAPPAIGISLSLIAGFAGGALWGGIAGILKSQFNVNEILSTIMMNQIAAQLMLFLLNGPLIDPAQHEAVSRIPQTQRIPEGFELPRLLPPTSLHIGVLLAVALAVIVYIFLWKTTIGYRIRAVGKNPNAALYAGISVKRTMILAFALSGALAGLAGVVQILGVQYRVSAEAAPLGLTGNAGFNGIVAALFGQLHPVGSVPASFFFAALLVGANVLQRRMQVPSDLITALNGIVVLFVVSSDYWRRQVRNREIAEAVASPSVHNPIPPTETLVEAAYDR